MQSGWRAGWRPAQPAAQRAGRAAARRVPRRRVQRRGGAGARASGGWRLCLFGVFLRGARRPAAPSSVQAATAQQRRGRLPPLSGAAAAAAGAASAAALLPAALLQPRLQCVLLLRRDGAVVKADVAVHVPRSSCNHRLWSVGRRCRQRPAAVAADGGRETNSARCTLPLPDASAARRDLATCCVGQTEPPTWGRAALPLPRSPGPPRT